MSVGLMATGPADVAGDDGSKILRRRKQREPRTAQSGRLRGSRAPHLHGLRSDMRPVSSPITSGYRAKEASVVQQAVVQVMAFAPSEPLRWRVVQGLIGIYVTVENRYVAQSPYIQPTSRFSTSCNRGEVMVLLVNLGPGPATIAHGDRVAQGVLAPVARAIWVEGPLDETARGAGGFGSTGV